MRSNASHPAGPHDRLVPKKVNWDNLHGGLPGHCERSTACRLCHLEPPLIVQLQHHWMTTISIIEAVDESLHGWEDLVYSSRTFQCVFFVWIGKSNNFPLF